MIHFLKLIRPVNLVIIALTMYSLRFFYFGLAGLETDLSHAPLKEQINFFLLVFSTILIAAAGNVINDYFDIKADRVNRPDRLIITKHIKRRWAIIMHWMLNGLAFLIGIYLSVYYHTFWYVFIHLLSINVLWFYSMYFKRKVIIGNTFIASLTAMVPILCGIHFYLVGHLPVRVALVPDHNSQWILFLAEHGRFIFGMAFFAFMLNFCREIIKDMQDVKGDELIFAKTLPMQIGLKKTAYFTAVMLSSIPLVALILYFVNKSISLDDLLFFLPFIISVAITVLVSLLLCLKFTLKALKSFDFMLKIAMLFGLVLPFYWFFIL